MTAAHRANERTPPHLARADRGDPDLMLDRWRFWERIRTLDRRYCTYVDLVLATAIFALSSWWVFHDDLSKTDLWFSAALAFPLVLRRRLPVPVFARDCRGRVDAVVRDGAAALGRRAPRRGLHRGHELTPGLWVLACAAVLETGIVMATVRWIPTGSDLESLVYSDGVGLHGPAGGRRDSRPTQSVPMAGRTGRAARTRARPAGVAGRGRGAGAHRA